MNADTPRLIRVAPATVIIFSVLFSPALLVAFSMIARSQPLPQTLALIAFYIAAVYWVSSPSIELDESRLVYRTLLKRQEIEFSEIEQVIMSANPAPTVTLTRKGNGGSSLSFIVKPFSKPGVAAMFSHIREHNPKAQFDGISQDMSTGDFASITKETLSTRNLIRIASTVGGSAFASALVRALMKH
jgi:hypothetical protein